MLVAYLHSIFLRNLCYINMKIHRLNFPSKSHHLSMGLNSKGQNLEIIFEEELRIIMIIKVLYQHNIDRKRIIEKLNSVILEQVDIFNSRKALIKLKYIK